MSLNRLELEKIARELNQLILPCRIDKVIEVDRQLYLFNVYSKSNYTLLLSLKPGWTRLHLCTKAWKKVSDNSAFTSYLRKHVQGGIIESIATINDDRIVELALRHGELSLYLVIEMFQKRENMLVLDSEKRILYHLNPMRDEMAINDIYTAPEGKIYDVKQMIPEQEDKLYNQVVEELYETRLREEHFTETMKSLAQFLKRELKNSNKTLENLKSQEDHCNGWVLWQQKGELLKSQYHLLKGGVDSVTLQNYFDPELKDITISIDPLKKPADNVEHYFKKSKKLKAGISHVKDRLIKAKEHFTRISKIYDDFEKVTEAGELKDFLARHSADRLIKRYKSAKTPQKKESQPAPRSYHEFISSSGKQIYVGKSGRENDRLTFQMAKGNDLWLHVRDYSGSHVIVPLKRDEDANQETLLDAATLAINYSKAKDHKEGEVIYTRRKHVSK
ncbi:MAG: NFACT RNA binding domain-containing protein, partial [Spirochaetota bacterium]|nr:NFACT RNA binding domain-containing protein [Spirochaetota bacterium]